MQAPKPLDYLLLLSQAGSEEEQLSHKPALLLGGHFFFFFGFSTLEEKRHSEGNMRQRDRTPHPLAHSAKSCDERAWAELKL